MKRIRDIKDLRSNTLIYSVYINNRDIYYYEFVTDVYQDRGTYKSRILDYNRRSIGISEWPFDMYDIFELDDKEILKLVSDAL